MPKANPAADDAAISETPAAEPATPPEADPVATQPLPASVDHPAAWRYVGDVRRIYPAIPVTVLPGDVMAWPVIPADDGRWEPCDAAPTRVPDNHVEED